MKQFTNKEQTRHLIELGFPRPESISEVNYYDEAYTTETEFEYDYSIGELIEFLGLHLMGIHAITVCDLPIIYVVQYQRNPNKVAYKEIQGELIDRLYEACAELKNEGVI